MGPTPTRQVIARTNPNSTTRSARTNPILAGCIDYAGKVEVLS